MSFKVSRNVKHGRLSYTHVKNDFCWTPYERDTYNISGIRNRSIDAKHNKDFQFQNKWLRNFSCVAWKQANSSLRCVSVLLNDWNSRMAGREAFHTSRLQNWSQVNGLLKCLLNIRTEFVSLQGRDSPLDKQQAATKRIKPQFHDRHFKLSLSNVYVFISMNNRN